MSRRSSVKEYTHTYTHRHTYVQTFMFIIVVLYCLLVRHLIWHVTRSRWHWHKEKQRKLAGLTSVCLFARVFRRSRGLLYSLRDIDTRVRYESFLMEFIVSWGVCFLYFSCLSIYILYNKKYLLYWRWLDIPSDSISQLTKAIDSIITWQ